MGWKDGRKGGKAGTRKWCPDDLRVGGKFASEPRVSASALKISWGSDDQPPGSVHAGVKCIAWAEDTISVGYVADRWDFIVLNGTVGDALDNKDGCKE